MNGGFAVGWRQVGICFVMLGITAMIATTYSVLAVSFSKEFHTSRTVLMLAMTVLSGASALLSTPLGRLMDRVATRRIVLAGSVSITLGYFLLSYVGSIGQVMVLYGLLIAPANVLLGPLTATVLLTRWFTRQRGKAIGLAITGIAVGTALFPPLLQHFIDLFGWNAALRIHALLLLVLTLGGAAFIVERPEDRGLHTDGDPVQAIKQGDAEQAPFSAMKVLSDPSFWMITVIVATITSGMKGMVTNLALLATDQGISPASAAGLISIYAGSAFVAKFGFAFVADRTNPRWIMTLSLLGYALGALGMTYSTGGYPMIAASVAATGVFGGLIMPLQSFLIPRVFGATVVGRAGGMLNSMTMIALLASPPLFGKIYDLTGSYDAMFLTYIGLALACLVLVPLVRLHPRGEDGPDRPLQAASPSP